VQALQGAELKAWRRSERQRLLALRTAVPPAERRLWGAEIEARLRALLLERPVMTLGVYWPFQAEFDPRALIDWVIAQGSAVAAGRSSGRRRLEHPDPGGPECSGAASSAGAARRI
jgi:5-formyltetrahydrofolate cyclo-ligase